MRAAGKNSSIASLLADLREDRVLALVKRRLAEGEDPLLLVKECQEGVRRVGERYEQGVYYISGLIMASAIMHEVGDMIFPLLKSSVSGNESGRIVLGTVQGDIHYIGKDIVKVLLRCYGFTVTDLGVDVPAEQFLASVKEIRPHVVGMSCLLNAGLESMKATVDLLKGHAGKTKPPFLIIGGCVDERVSGYVGADAWSTDAMSGVRVCQKVTRGGGGAL
jgi:methanogenic corrinoid protein MtbC1